MTWVETAHRCPGWRGRHFWIVTTRGGHSLAEVSRTWTVIDVVDASYQLQLALYDELI